MAEPDRQIEGQHHADGDRLAMQQSRAVAGLDLERVAESVTQVEQRADPGLALVGSDDAGGAEDAGGAGDAGAEDAAGGGDDAGKPAGCGCGCGEE